MSEITRELVYGKSPIQRSNPQAGQSEWYHLDPRGAETVSEMKQIDVPDEHSPNPYANEIRNYLYNNDRDNYKLLYGDTKPTQNNGTSDNLWSRFRNGVNKFEDATTAASVGYATGYTLGNFDEMIGTASAALTADRNNYAIGRDAVRKLQKDAQEKHPYLYGGAEFVGSMMTPMHLLDDTTNGNKIFNAATDTVNASAGYAENWPDFGINMIANGLANTAGYYLEQLPIFRATGNIGARFLRKSGKFVKQGINSLTDKAKSMFYNPDKKDI